jgi:hypothetical protein
MEPSMLQGVAQRAFTDHEAMKYTLYPDSNSQRTLITVSVGSEFSEPFLFYGLPNLISTLFIKAILVISGAEWSTV